MEYREKTLHELGLKASEISSKSALVGFDGFVDKIVNPVDQRHGKGDDFTPISTIAEFGGRISAASGKSANIEMYQRMEKLGGNGPIMAHALLSGGSKVRYIGALGKPAIHPVFKEFAEETDAVSITGPGITTAAEFKDGKIMLGDMQSLDEVTYDSMVEAMGEGALFDAFSRADLIAMVNWTMLPNMSNLFIDLIERVFPNLGPRDHRNFFFDLADPAKRSEGDIASVLNIIKRFQNFGSVTLGLNFSEAQQIYSVLGHEKADSTPDELKRMAMTIRQDLDIATVVVHPTTSAACANRDGAWWVEGPYCEHPKITTGAGDHFNAGFATGQLLGLSPEACLTTAVCVSGSYVRTAKSPSLSDVSHFLRGWDSK
ncbi:PfkB family carbohydrate kinase [Rubellicoccus peritrichatus]|uniref:PfkB family carbohydrate kinase n=1 Tax=Rubellicoccus peritrichatus TaxID=3080537 RepID=A0AAQ3QUR0_9BACT|nr:PfkB family carbohydrate kinase [Puniceicoccus sp. CR14]WOO40668.1 PfkB family carbohydrate kinase [Puniceicoccus sp. CR14]